MEFKRKDFYTIDDLLEIVGILRHPEYGCDWDKVQTHKSIRKDFIEETYEAVDAIDNNDKVLLREELGDVLLQVMMHAQMEKEINSFTFADVVNDLAQKLVMRHPHVFTGLEVNSVDEVLTNWEAIKNDSHGHNTVSRTVNAVPKSFPALMYTQKVLKRVNAGKVPVPSIKEETDSIRRLMDKIDSDAESSKPTGEDLAAVLMSTVNIIRHSKMDAEELLGKKSADFVKIFNIFEDLALQNGIRFDTIDNAVSADLWAQAENVYKNK